MQVIWFYCYNEHVNTSMIKVKCFNGIDDLFLKNPPSLPTKSNDPPFNCPEYYNTFIQVIS